MNHLLYDCVFILFSHLQLFQEYFDFATLYIIEKILKKTNTKSFLLSVFKHLSVQGYTDLLERPGLQIFARIFKDICQII